VITLSDGVLWLVILALGLGTFLIRFSFLGLAGGRSLPPWLLRLLRYVPVSILPALVAPMVAWPQATGGEPEPARLSAACAALLIGALTRHVLSAVIGGLVVLYVVLALTR
jgi:branched-subunit amino acid transport protein